LRGCRVFRRSLILIFIAVIVVASVSSIVLASINVQTSCMVIVEYVM